MIDENVIAHLLFNNVEPNTFNSFIDLKVFYINPAQFNFVQLYIAQKFETFDLKQFDFEKEQPWFKHLLSNINTLKNKYLDEQLLLKSEYLQNISDRILSNTCTDEHKAWLLTRNITDKEIEKYHISSVENLSNKKVINSRINIFTRTLANIPNEYINGIIFPCIKNNSVFNIIIRNIDDTSVYIKFSNCCPEAVFFNIDHLYIPNNTVYLCEGVFDAIAIEQQGHNAVAFSSGVPYIEQLTIILILTMKYNLKLKLMFDNDVVGRKISYIIKSLCEDSVEEIPYDSNFKDPAEFFNK